MTRALEEYDGNVVQVTGVFAPLFGIDEISLGDVNIIVDRFEENPQEFVELAMNE